MPVPSPLWVFRMVHLDNLRFILEQGMYAGTQAERDPNYIFIGDSTLTQQRETLALPFPQAGNIGDYVAFYFSPRSPMLLNIKTGYRGIPQRPQSDIVYVCCRLDALEEIGLDWVFTDGHAKNSLSTFYQDKARLDQVDWDLRWEPYWQNTEEDPDRQRRIGSIVVLNEETKTVVTEILAEVSRNVDVYINPQGKFYY